MNRPRMAIPLVLGTAMALAVAGGCMHKDMSDKGMMHDDGMQRGMSDTGMHDEGMKDEGMMDQGGM